MSAHALRLTPSAPANLRPFDIRRDLMAVADLVELCFAGSLDADGRLYIRQMRQSARNGYWQDAVIGADPPLGGMVWVEAGRIVGNLSLIPHPFEGRRIYLIANVAVHPEHRRRGIAHQLTQAALAEIEKRGSFETWLQVDENNVPALKLYSHMGFEEKMRRTSWRLLPNRARAANINAIKVRPRTAADWSLQKEWLAENYPRDLRWHLPLEFGLLAPGLLGGLQRAFSERRSEQWSALEDGRLLGVFSWQSSVLEADRIWLAAPRASEAAAIAALASKAHAQFTTTRKLALNYAAGRATQALEAAGFNAVRTLIWMQYPWPA
jgi:ribosomal protein S18 acetylase RimI-like enzyme